MFTKTTIKTIERHGRSLGIVATIKNGKLDTVVIEYNPAFGGISTSKQEFEVPGSRWRNFVQLVVQLNQELEDEGVPGS